jgi:molybdopterin converting factor small subunit
MNDGLRGLLRRWIGRAPDGATIRVHVLIKGRIGDGWQDVDRTLELPLGATLADLIEHAHARGIALRDAIDKSPHLRHTLMLNGERCPVDENLTRALADGDQVYLLAPLAGG